MTEPKQSHLKHYHLDKSYLASPLSFGTFRLFQIGRLYCTGQTVVDKHAHINWFELTIVTQGRGAVLTNDVSIPVEAGDIYLSFPCDFHAIASDPQAPLHYDFFAFGTEDPAFSADLEQIVQTHMPPDCRILRDDTIASLVGAAIAELDGERPYSDTLLSALFTQLLIRLIRGFLYEGNTRGRANVTDTDALCYRLMNYIDTHIYTMTGLEELAEATNYNYSYLSSLFHKTTSGTLTDYYRRRRLETARLLIGENELNMTEIAALLHYSSIYTFSRAFRDQYGTSPTQYKKNLQGSEAQDQTKPWNSIKNYKN